MKSITILAAVAAVASATATYRPLAQASTGGRIVAGDYDADLDEYALKLGERTGGVEFKRAGKQLKTEDNYCMTAVDDKVDSPVVLAPCGDADKASSWTFNKKTYQWKNGYRFCLGFAEGPSGNIVQAKCQTGMLAGMGQGFTFVDEMPKPQPSPPQPSPPPAPVTCAAMSKKWLCPKGYALIPKPDATTCSADAKDFVARCCYVPPPPPTISCSAFGQKYMCPKGYTLSPKAPSIACLADLSNCVQQCCVPAPTTQLCGQWSVKNGGPINACGAGYTYVAGDRDQCSITGADCQKRCCAPTRPEQQKCGSWSVKNGGPVNACGTGYTYTAGDNDMCNLDGSNCKTECCSETQTWPCMSWSVQQGGPNTACPEGTFYTANPADVCNFEPSNCADVCCGTN